jgi:hypothetical protein
LWTALSGHAARLCDLTLIGPAARLAFRATDPPQHDLVVVGAVEIREMIIRVIDDAPRDDDLRKVST